MAAKLRAIHYLNQYFAGIGAEDKAGAAPQWFDGARGPGKLLERLAPDIEIVGTVAAGDDYVAQNIDDAITEIVNLIESKVHDSHAEVLLAGPAFNAGRYGMACGALCEAVQTQLALTAVSAMYPENPAVEIYRRKITIARATEDVLGMQEAVKSMAAVGLKLASGESVVPSEDATIARGVRQNYFASHTGAERALSMLLRKMAGKPFETEYKLPEFDRVPPAPAIADAGHATLALVTSGGIVPRGNPDRIESANASRYGAYCVAGLAKLTDESHQCVHGGYDPTYANADPNRVVPLDAARALEREGRIGRLHDTYYATVGNATSVDRAKAYGAEIAARLVNEGVQAVIFTST